MQDFTYGKLILGGRDGERGGASGCLDSMNGFHNSIVEMRDCKHEPTGPEDSQVCALQLDTSLYTGLGDGSGEQKLIVQ